MRTEVIASVIAAAAAFGAAGISYVSSKEVAGLQRAIVQLEQVNARQRPFLEHQLSHYIRATGVASALANTADQAITADLEQQFWELYWGSLAIFEDQRVSQAMIAFGKALESGDPGTLKDLSIKLALACRRSIRDQWHIDLEDIEQQRSA